jgi:hypothetical protein
VFGVGAGAGLLGAGGSSTGSSGWVAISLLLPWLNLRSALLRQSCASGWLDYRGHHARWRGVARRRPCLQIEAAMVIVIVIAVVGFFLLLCLIAWRLHQMDELVKNEKARFLRSAETYPEWRAKNLPPSER